MFIIITIKKKHMQISCTCFQIKSFISHARVLFLYIYLSFKQFILQKYIKIPYKQFILQIELYYPWKLKDYTDTYKLKLYFKSLILQNLALISNCSSRKAQHFFPALQFSRQEKLSEVQIHAEKQCSKLCQIANSN